MPRRWAALTCVVLLGLVQPATAAQTELRCPDAAPADWGLKPTPSLSGVEILSARKGEKIDEKAPPSLVPDTSDTRNGTLHQTWQMNSDGPEWSYFIDCHFGGTSRILRIDAGGTTLCDYTVAPFGANGREGPNARHRLVCH